jgi:hypothetical protein
MVEMYFFVSHTVFTVHVMNSVSVVTSQRIRVQFLLGTEVFLYAVGSKCKPSFYSQVLGLFLT